MMSSAGRGVHLRDGLDGAVVDRAVQVWCAALRASLTACFFDVYSDRPWPQDVMPVCEQLGELSRRRRAASGKRRGDEGMGVTLDPADDDEFAMFLAVMPLSIHAEAAIGERHAIVAHDCGMSVWGYLTDDEARAVCDAFEVAGLPCDAIVEMPPTSRRRRRSRR